MEMKEQNLIREYLGKNSSPESYNFEEEYQKTASLSTLDRYFRYQAAQYTGSDYSKAKEFHDEVGKIPHPDGSGGRKKGTYLICDIYEALWNWNRNGKSTFAKIRFDNFQCEFGADTMNSVQTSFNKLAEDIINGNQIFEKPIKDYYSSGYLLQLYRTNKETFCALLTENFKNNGFQSYIDCYHTIGNFVLVPKLFNGKRGYSLLYNGNKVNDYWDISLMYLRDRGWNGLEQDDFNKYINYFFLWDYVSENDNSYTVKELSNTDSFFKTTVQYIKRRGIFMIAMLKIQQDFSDVYEMIQNMLLQNTVFKGYANVIEKIKERTEEHTAYETIRSILDNAICRINKI